MDLRKLEIFCAVAEQQSFSRAAASLHMAQPAVSIAVRRLEQELDCTLFERVGRRVRLTAEGGALQRQAADLIARAEEIKASFSGFGRLEAGQLSIACPSMLATYYLPVLLRDFLVNYPGLQASITQAGTSHIRRMLLEDEIEAGVITAQPGGEDSELELLPLVGERVVVCVSARHPWSKRRYLNLGQLDGEPMVVYESGYFIREQFSALCRGHGVTPELRMQTNFLPLINEMVKAGIGVGIGLKMMADQEPGIVGIPLRPAIEIDLALAKRKGRRISLANQAFMDWLSASSRRR
jgi:DNA-binding transcriptional LysR family regulator